jgi:aurora kinase
LSEQAKNLIKKILVYEPEKRLSLEDIKEHPWVNKYK